MCIRVKSGTGEGLEAHEHRTRSSRTKDLKRTENGTWERRDGSERRTEACEEQMRSDEDWAQSHRGSSDGDLLEQRETRRRKREKEL